MSLSLPEFCSQLLNRLKKGAEDHKFLWTYDDMLNELGRSDLICGAMFDGDEFLFIHKGVLLLDFWSKSIDELKGLVFFRKTDDKKYDLMFVGVVEPRKGWATKTIENAVRHLEGLSGGDVEIMLEVRASNKPAQALYKKVGFRVIDKRKGYYSSTKGEVEDAIVYSLP